MVTANAQDNAQPPIPEFKNKVMFVNKTNTLAELESIALTLSSKAGFGKGSNYLRVDGVTSSVSHSGTPKNRFIVKIDPGTDPSTTIYLYKFEVDKKYRKILTGTVGIGGVKDGKIVTMPLTFTKVSDGVYIVSPKDQLPDGEYVFTVNNPITNTSNQETKGFGFSVAQS